VCGHGRFSPLQKRRRWQGGELLSAERHVPSGWPRALAPTQAGKTSAASGVHFVCGGGAATGVALGVRRRHHGALNCTCCDPQAPATARAIAGSTPHRLRTRRPVGSGGLPACKAELRDHAETGVPDLPPVQRSRGWRILQGSSSGVLRSVLPSCQTTLRLGPSRISKTGIAGSLCTTGQSPAPPIKQPQRTTTNRSLINSDLVVEL